MAHPAVSSAAVVAVQQDGLDKPKAFIVARDEHRPTTDAERAALSASLQKHVKDCLSKHKYPRWIEFVDDLPKNDRGKVDRKRLVAMR